MLISKCLNLVLEMDFMTLNILNLDILFISLNLLYTSEHHHNFFFVENHQLNVIYYIINKI